jgi:hypothetical protein
MTSPMQRSRHSDLPEGPGFAAGFTNRVDSQRDLWRFLLPYGHLQAAGLRGGGVVAGLHVSGAADSPGLVVTPGQALDGRGRLLVIPAATGDDLAVRLRRASTSDVGTEGLATVGADGVTVPTTGLSGEHLLVLEWNETRLTLDGETVYRLTPWLRLEHPPAAPKDEWVVLARVILGSGDDEGRVKALDAGPRRALTSLRDGLTLSRPQAVTEAAGALRVEQAPAARIALRDGGGIDFQTWGGAPDDWRTPLSVGPDAALGTDILALRGMLQVEGDVRARAISAASLTLESLPVPLVRGGSVEMDALNWRDQFGVEQNLTATVDTSSAGFAETPVYFAVLVSPGRQRVPNGITAISTPATGSFNVVMPPPSGAMIGGVRIPTKPSGRSGRRGHEETGWERELYQWGAGWRINWVGILPR